MNIKGPVLVTGGTGFIGRRVIARLLELGIEALSFALPGEPVPEAWGDDVKVLRGDIANRDDVFTAVEGVGTVIHLAAIVGMGEYSDHWRVTVEGSRNIYDAALSTGAKVLLASSIVTYGHQIRTEVCQEDLAHGEHQGAYSWAKMAQEKLALEYMDRKGLCLSVIRPANVYGWGSGPWCQTLMGLAQMDMLPLADGGAGDAGLVHVNNLVEAILLACEPKADGEIYTICDESGVTWKQFFTDMAGMVGKAALPEPSTKELIAAALALEDPKGLKALPQDSGVLPLEFVNLIGHSNRFDCTKARQDLGWAPTMAYDEAMDEIRKSLAHAG